MNVLLIIPSFSVPMVATTDEIFHVSWRKDDSGADPSKSGNMLEREEEEEAREIEDKNNTISPKYNGA